MRFVSIICLFCLFTLPVSAQRDLTRYVNPFIGTAGHGHTFPGAIVPFGMIQLSPDTRLTGWDGCSGYHYTDSAIYGFSHTHLCGTGISDYGDILLMPAVGQPFLDPRLVEPYSTHFDHRNERATPGYYSVKLDDHILVELTATATVKAVAITPKLQRSSVVTATYHRIPHDWKITLQSSYSSQYTGGGDFALIDGIRGSANWSGGRWQGYQGQDLVAVLDLGAVQSVSKVSAGFLQDVGSWIWMPKRVEIELSVDGRTYGPAFSITNEVSEKQEGVVTKDFVKTISPQMARYVRIRAVNFGKIPARHPGSGGDAWIFVDEIMIEK
jgi:hypothetical protein